SFYARHNMSYWSYISAVNAAKSWGMSPSSVSVTSEGGQLRYAALFHRRGSSNWEIRPSTRAADYQAEFNAQVAAGRSLVALQSYMHDGQVRYAAVYSDGIRGAWLARNSLSPLSYALYHSYYSNAGYRNTVLTGVDGASSPSLAAVWRR
ncbi:MAG: hypothetical protein KC492_25020, partial [Myxococcales bacterium]|nr:hypothetical protein [Myxococcales bacterium]